MAKGSSVDVSDHVLSGALRGTWRIDGDIGMTAEVRRKSAGGCNTT
jgi:hypothetical protein